MDFLSKAEIKEICLENGITVVSHTEGQPQDIHPFVYAAIEACLKQAFKKQAQQLREQILQNSTVENPLLDSTPSWVAGLNGLSLSDIKPLQPSTTTKSMDNGEGREFV